MLTTVDLLSQPADHLLCAGIHTLPYFRKEERSSSPGCRLELPEENKVAIGLRGSEVEPASCNQKVAGLIPLVCMSKCP